MRKFYVLLILLTASSLASAKTISTESLVNIVSTNTLDNCKINGFNILNARPDFAKTINGNLNKFGSLNISNFDASDCLTSRNVSKDVLTSHFYQKNKKTVGHSLQMFSALNLKSGASLIAIIDNNNQSYILGGVDPQMKAALQESFGDNDYFQKVNFDSRKEFGDIASANKGPQIDTNSPNSNESLLKQAKINLAKRGVKDLIKTDTSFDLSLEDGEGNKRKSLMMVSLDKKNPIPLLRANLISNTNILSSVIKYKLKNPYSYKPREILATQQGDELEIIIKYTATNSYGAEVVGIDGRKFYLKASGEFNSTPNF
ncbi:hypothetical protein [Acinetobacter sp. Ver3]|uniref:hypothetical protein n=1 Tax=Acinetobacter sp. Ver3 TaxID=466088 RepID=UPI000449009F|nr:hypothetical protein [Acinetobacter sp. Ver3]EZQ10731.1 hypothetical protein CL42_06235 [Acinetobacter sp. Ver3]